MADFFFPLNMHSTVKLDISFFIDASSIILSVCQY